MLKKLFEEEVNARERAVASNPPAVQRKMQSKLPTAAALVAGSSVSVNSGVTCSYCGQGHPSVSCNSVADVTARKEILYASLVIVILADSVAQISPVRSAEGDIFRSALVVVVTKELNHLLLKVHHKRHP